MSENPGNRKTITIKINGKERPFHDKEKGSVELNSSTLIEGKNAEKFGDEVAAGSETIDDESFDWILPNEDEMEEKPPILANDSSAGEKNTFLKKKIKQDKGNKKSVNKGLVPSIFFTVLFAVVLGTGFGIILLKMVSSDQQVASNPNVAVSQGETETKVEKKTNEEAKEAAAGTETSAVTATKKDISTFIIQHIILSNENAVKQVQSQLKNEGYISQEIAVNGKIAVYLGVAGDLEEAKTWAKAIKKDKVEAFAKPITFNGGGKIKNVTKEEKSFIENSPAIYNAITVFVSSAQFGESSSAEAKKELKKQQAVLEEMKISAFKNKEVKNMAIQLNEGITKSVALDDNGKGDTQAIQKNLLAFLEKYVQLN
ncbi:SPOR domain-containing protein [Niallia sp. NCCP-28]|uniref:SPOR domain-containing protein n=1 Tax=Niallia sp. NCCP-28 TaxID=2934712 RepID=UPI00208CEBAA|nr:SPOR domain-containing protein [Niallia sp. NCCP-28]GKU81439.1 hypothetical protein NCCP28_08350 [Niallia sp. NCCP-28]